MSSAWTQGLLGFAAGATEQMAENEKLKSKWAYDEEAERRRLYTSELKERRMAEFRKKLDLQYGSEERQLRDEETWAALGGREAFLEQNPSLTWMQGEDARDYLKTDEGRKYAERIYNERHAQETAEEEARYQRGLKDRREDTAGSQQFSRDFRQEGWDYEKQQPRGWSPGSVIAAPETISKNMDPQGFYTVSESGSQRLSKANANSSFVDQQLSRAEDTAFGNTTKLSSTQLNKVGTVSYSVLTGDASGKENEAVVAFDSLLNQMAANTVTTQVRAATEGSTLSGDPSAVIAMPELKSDTLAKRMTTERDAIAKGVERAVNLYKKHLRSGGIPSDLTGEQMLNAITQMLSEAEVKMTENGQDYYVKPIEMLEKQRRWHPALTPMMVQTMLDEYARIKAGK